MSDNRSDILFSHVLQKTGILKNFSIAKIVPLIEIEKIKKEIKEKSKSQEEFALAFQKKLAAYQNMHDPKNPIPGIIYLEDEEKKQIAYRKYAKEWAKKIKMDNPSRQELAFLIKAMIIELGLTKEDFQNEDSDEDSEDDV
jgi:hypothetical protein